MLGSRIGPGAAGGRGRAEGRGTERKSQDGLAAGNDMLQRVKSGPDPRAGNTSLSLQAQRSTGLDLDIHVPCWLSLSSLIVHSLPVSLAGPLPMLVP